MAISVLTAVGAGLALIFVTIVLFHYIREPTKKRLHLLTAFALFSLGFIVSAVSEIMLASSGPTVAAIVLFRFFDVFEIVGVFWFFIFLTDFIESQKNM